jgi:hypothetical protein
MRRRIALQSTSCEILVRRLCYFAKLLECVRVPAPLWIFGGPIQALIARRYRSAERATAILASDKTFACHQPP